MIWSFRFFGLPLIFSLLVFQQGNSSEDKPIPDNTPPLLQKTEVLTDWAPFYHGIASGDPLTDRVIIWTRVTPEEITGAAIEVAWRMATDVQMANVVASGNIMTDADRDYTVKVDVTGLQPGTTYYYLFSALGRNSLIGRTRTTPAGNQTDHLRFGVVSCANYQAGYFNAFQRLSERNDLDAIIHLGDYIYEYGNGINGDPDLFEERPVEPRHEIVTLDDYRTRYAVYRRDTSLVRAHQQHAFITVWDDHEVANNASRDGAFNHDPETEGDWETRKAAAIQAWFEWQPVRETEDRKIYRRISYGNLMDLFMLDTRLEDRDPQIFDVTNEAVYAPDRTMLGSTQKNWLLEQLGQSEARWKVVGQQVMFSPFNIGFASLAVDTLSYEDVESEFLDIWDGYPAERAEIIQFIREQQMDNIVILTGDFHTAFAYDVVDNPVDVTFQNVPFVGTAPFYSANANYEATTGAGSVAVEFGSPSITAHNFDEVFGTEYASVAQTYLNTELVFGTINLGNPNPHLKYVDVLQHGYMIFDVKADSVQADWFYSRIESIQTAETTGESWYTLNGGNHLLPAVAISAAKMVADEPAPPDPPIATPVRYPVPVAQIFVLTGLYPNPAGEGLTLEYTLQQPTPIRIDLYDGAGRRLRTLGEERQPAGTFQRHVDVHALPPGPYFLRIGLGGQNFSVEWIKK